MIWDGNILILSCLLALYSIFFIELIFWRTKTTPRSMHPSPLTTHTKNDSKQYTVNPQIPNQKV